MKFYVLALCSCGPKNATQQSPKSQDSPAAVLAEVHPLNGITALNCSAKVCHVETSTGVAEFQVDTMTVEHLDTPPQPPTEPWATATPSTDRNSVWNTQVAKQWRSPFQVDIPAPSGGLYRSNRGVGPGTSRVVRLGGSVVTARQGLDPGPIAYPRNLALHPTGTEAYHIVWPNPDLIAFNARTLETTWRIRLAGPAVGLFVSKNGRYLLAELDGQAPEHQLLDYEPSERSPPEGTDPWADPVLRWLERPPAKRTALVDLALGETVAIVPGTAVGLALTKDGAVVAASEGIAKVVSARP